MANKIRLTESELKNIVRESVIEVLKESDMDEGFFQNLGRGIKGVAKGVGNAVGNVVDNAKMNAYQAQMQGMQADNEKLQQQINAIEASREQRVNAAVNQVNQQINQQIAAIKAKMGDVQGMQSKWDAAGKRINQRQQTGYINNRQYSPQNAMNPQQGQMNY